MPYNLPQRKSPRAAWHDYNGGNYFVTFCTKNRELYFGDIVDGRMQLSDIGKYAHSCAEKIPEINDNILVPEFVVMPNHVHMIVVMANLPESTDDVRLPQYVWLPRWDSPTAPQGDETTDGDVVGLPYHDSRNDNMPDCENVSYYDSRWEINEEMQRRSHCCGRLSRIIGQYKSVVTKYANQNDISFAWQPRFHDHIIRNWTEMNHIARYIQNNPMQWELDRFYKKR